jgi:hypothetical protein
MLSSSFSSSYIGGIAFYEGGAVTLEDAMRAAAVLCVIPVLVALYASSRRRVYVTPRHVERNKRNKHVRSCVDFVIPRKSAPPSKRQGSYSNQSQEDWHERFLMSDTPKLP